MTRHGGKRAGAGRRPSGDSASARIAYRCSPALLQRATDASAKAGVSLAEFAREALEHQLDAVVLVDIEAQPDQAALDRWSKKIAQREGPITRQKAKRT